MGDLSAQKDAARKAAFGRRKVAHMSGLGQAACANLTEFLAPYLGQPISAYMAIRTEVDPLEVMKKLDLIGPVGVPVIQGAHRPLEFHRWRDGCDMQDGPFGARIPRVDELVVPKVVILPMLAFDLAGHRLGYGGGYYDRTLELLRAAGPVLAVGFAYGAQQVESLPVEPTDQPLDVIVTEAGVCWFGRE